MITPAKLLRTTLLTVAVSAVCMTMQFTVEEENLICMYHKSDRRRTAANIRAALPDMDEDMAALARQTADKLDTMHDADFEAQQFHFTDE